MAEKMESECCQESDDACGPFVDQEREIAALRAAITQAIDLLAERTHGSSARSPGHNARTVLEESLRR